MQGDGARDLFAEGTRKPGGAERLVLKIMNFVGFLAPVEKLTDVMQECGDDQRIGCAERLCEAGRLQHVVC